VEKLGSIPAFAFCRGKPQKTTYRKKRMKRKKKRKKEEKNEKNKLKVQENIIYWYAFRSKNSSLGKTY